MLALVYAIATHLKAIQADSDQAVSSTAGPRLIIIERVVVWTEMSLRGKNTTSRDYNCDKERKQGRDTS